ncbi:ATP synthase F1 subcomplex delta subunit [Pseudopedobacter saltans DSM 12145]|uniref:ATP synthase subunit delta n=1 Tax=Pseudopedobacter saltans (strain ATCC 51119 / DSM 12145 / JCM 21818 / CCUG 39354 / LMG 10337 / NBRC 100064 / NCIMB 13643) TaxID=762903 RepID=F0S4N5_PSESL|nr:ATP synthase F1 subunit delta [Pseudopedobacter saltans]ADY53053.1 ATP synthase F1 subcomplex delta subunit [Pseudopedobacter saltans DSM 12145]
MSEIKVASRYAKSLLDLAIEKNVEKEVRNDMQLFADTLKANPELATVIKNPIISLDKKRNILSAIFEGKLQQVTYSFFNIMINKGRAAVLQGAAREFVNQYNVHNNINTVKVVSATPLTEISKEEIINRVKSVLGGEVILNASVDENLIGGIVLTIGDKQYDASIASKLSQLKKAFA